MSLRLLDGSMLLLFAPRRQDNKYLEHEYPPREVDAEQSVAPDAQAASLRAAGSAPVNWSVRRQSMLLHVLGGITMQTSALRFVCASRSGAKTHRATKYQSS